MLYYQQLVIWCQEDFSDNLGERLEEVVDMLLVGIANKGGARLPIAA